MGHGGDVIAELMADHREVEDLFQQFRAMTTGDAERRKVVDHFTIELVRHSVAEEQYLYPAVREHVIGGGELADKELADHAKVEQLLKDMSHLAGDDPKLEVLVNQLVAEVTAHVADEEKRLFPALLDACSADALNELGDKVRTAKTFAPTRPHPSAPDTPPANKLLAPGAGMVDRLRDFFTGRGTP